MFKDLLGDGIFNVDGHMWESQRKAASKEFSVVCTHIKTQDTDIHQSNKYAHI